MRIRFLKNESLINCDKDNIFSESQEEEGAYSLKFLYDFYQSEYGRCTGNTYQTQTHGDVATGWVYLSRTEYSDDRPSTYLQESWVSFSLEIEFDGGGLEIPYDVVRDHAVIGQNNETGLRLIVRRGLSFEDGVINIPSNKREILKGDYESYLFQRQRRTKNGRWINHGEPMDEESVSMVQIMEAATSGVC